LRRVTAMLAQLATPLAVVALLAITAKLTLDARSAERSHRTAAESALRDYASFAAWEYSRHVTQHMRSHLMMSLSPVRDRRVRAGTALPPPKVLSDRARECGCGFKTDIAFAFRYEIGGGSLVTDRPVAAPALSALARHLAPAIERIATRLTTAREMAGSEAGRDMLRETAAVALDTLGGRPFVLAYGLVFGDGPRPRAVYGIASDTKHLHDDFARVVRNETLLPPSLVRGRPNDSLLAIRTMHPVTGPVWQSSAPPVPGMLTHSDTVAAWLGGLITSVAIRPELASTLLIGGVPTSRLPLQLAMLSVATALALVALVQIRRTRELGRLRERFVANVSHELRTPLAQISMLSETLMLGRERSERERRDFAAVVYREARRLTTLVESVLRFSRGQATRTRVTAESRSVAGDIHESMEAFGPIARAAEVTIDVRVPDDLTMRVDAGAFRQVMLNLFDNAVKFGPRGQTVVVDAAAQKGAVVVAVTDQGRGIPERDRQHVFHPYTRLKFEGQPSVTGAGIGLSVVRDLVDAHGGRVWIETPPPGSGTRVVFTVPRTA
jgi:signal transduction histidine kinase